MDSYESPSVPEGARQGKMRTKDGPRQVVPHSNEQWKPALRIFQEQVEATDFESPKSRKQLEEFKGLKPNFKDTFLHQLAIHSDKDFWLDSSGQVSQQSTELLKWIIKTDNLRRLFSKHVTPAGIGVDSERDELTPLQFAIDKSNHYFLECFLKVCEESKDDAGDARKLLQKQPLGKDQDNCLHRAIAKKLPWVQRMVALCDEQALRDTNSAGNTPLHLAMTKDNGKTFSTRPTRPTDVTPNSSKPRAEHQEYEFRTPRIFDELEKRDMSGELLAELLTKTNSSGLSPYQLRIQTFSKEESKPSEIDFQSKLSDFIFSKIPHIPDVSRALYGTRGFEKELSLDMSDFNNSSHDFKVFIDKLIKLDEISDADTDESYNGRTEADGNATISDLSPDPSRGLSFESCLFFVYLPDFNNFRKPCPHEGVRGLFQWLSKDKRVKRIKALNIPDSTTSPMSDEFAQEAIIKPFQIEKFDWRKLDLNLDTLTRTSHADMFTELTLYSSGNWSVLYHWTSDDGLPKLSKLKKVTIKIVTLNPSEGIHDDNAHKLHEVLVNGYKERLLTYHQRRQKSPQDPSNTQKLNYKYALEIHEKARWSFPILKYSGNDEPFIPKLQFLDQLLDTYKLLDRFKDSVAARGCAERFQELTMPPQIDEPDRRIKVAIIDNGVDRIRTNVKTMIAKGISFVSADQDANHRILPWWMVADPHGTQMASLVAQANNYCRLYIARVGKGRKDILPEHAAKAILWSLEQDVDIISISWVIKTPNEALENAIIEAVKEGTGKRKTLIFCSTADEGVYSGSIYPAKYPGVVSVAATDPYGNLRPPSDGRVNIRVPGEDIVADGPSYMPKDVARAVSGSSVATALATGIASLALLMIKTFNRINDDDERLNKLYSKEGIMKVFKKMESGTAGVQLANLFPNGVGQNQEKLEEIWSLKNFV